MAQMTGTRTVVYSRGDSHGHLGEDSTLDVKGMAAAIDVERPTVMNWMATGVLIPVRNERIGPRRSIAFDPTYAAEIAPIVKAAKRKKGKSGGPILTSEFEEKIQIVNERFYPDRYK